MQLCEFCSKCSNSNAQDVALCFWSRRAVPQVSVPFVTVSSASPLNVLLIATQSPYTNLRTLHMVQVGDPFALAAGADPFAAAPAPAARAAQARLAGALPENMFSAGLGLGSPSGPAAAALLGADAGLGIGPAHGGVGPAPNLAPGFAQWGAPTAAAPAPAPVQVTPYPKPSAFQHA